jgi:hypothetical protein
MAQQGGLLLFRLEDADVPTVASSIPYGTPLHRYWRIREVGGDIVWETSADRCDWIERERAETPDFVRALWIEIGAEVGDTPVAPGTVAFDELNTDGAISDYCLAGSFFDTFDDGSMAMEWAGSPDPEGECTRDETGGVVSFDMSGEGASRCLYQSATAYDLRGGFAWVNIPSISHFRPTMRTFFEVQDGSGAFARILFQNDLFVAETGPVDMGFTFFYDHSPYWRLREESGEIVFEVSWDSMGPWTEGGRGALDIDASAVGVSFGVETSVVMDTAIGIGVHGYNVE